MAVIEGARPARDATPPRIARSWALPRREAVPLLIVLVLTLIGGVLRRYHLGQQSLWFDEADLVMRAREPLGSLLGNFVQPGENGPLYTLGLAVWMKALGTSEIAVRLPSAIAGTLAIPAMYGLGRELRGPRLGVIAAALLTISPYAHWYAQDAKMYSLVVLLTIVATWLLLVAVRRGGGWWIVYGVAAAVALGTHATFVLVLIAHVVILGLLWRAGYGTWPRGAIGRWLVALVGIAALPLIVWAVLFAIGHVPTWQVSATPWAILRRMLVEFSATHRANAAVQTWAAALSLALAALGVVLTWRGAAPSPVPPAIGYPAPAGAGEGSIAEGAGPYHTGHGARDESPRSRSGGVGAGAGAFWPPRIMLLIVGGITAIPGALFLIISLKQPVFEDRYLIVTLPGFLLLVALGFDGLLRWRWGWPAAIVAGVAVLWLAWVPLRDVNLSTQSQKEDWREAYRNLAAHARAGDGVVIYPGYLRTTYDYYALRFPALHDLPIVMPPALAADTDVSDRALNAFFQNETRGWERAWLVESPERVPTQDPQGRIRGFYTDGIPNVQQRPQTLFAERKFNGVRLDTFVYNGPFQSDRLPPQLDVDVTFGTSGIGLVGTNLQPLSGCNPRVTALCTAPRGTFVPLLLRWIAPDRAPTTDYTVLVRLVDANGNEVGHYDIPPLDGHWPTNTWHPKDDPYDPHDLFLAPDLPSGTYTIMVGLAPASDPTHPLPVTKHDGTRIDANGLIPIVKIGVT
jgi:4-amino-4-deoxy-L-arabinose transferase-like glycosyltransferase